MKLMKYLLLLGLFCLVPLQGYCEARLPKALIITGSGPDLDHGQKYPPWVHEFQNDKVVEILKDIVEIEVTDDLSMLNDKTLKNYDLVISNSIFLTPRKDQLAALKKFITSGKSFMTLHCGLLSFLNADYYQEMMSGIFIGGPSTDPESFPVITENSEFWFYDYNFRPAERHPISKMVDDFVIKDELYYFQPNTSDLRVIARAENHPIMWEKTWKKGRVMNFVLGHDLQAKENPGYQALLKNGVRWLLGYPLVQKIPDVRFDSSSTTIDNFLNLNQYADIKDNSKVTFSVVGNTNPDLLELNIDQRGELDLVFKRKQGSAKVRIQATSSSGLTAFTTFNVTLDAERTGNIANYYGVQAFSSAVELRKDVEDPANLTDSNMDTRWASASVDPSWVVIDLGRICKFSQLVLHWESSFGSAYEIQVANTAEQTWQTVFKQEQGDGNRDDIMFAPTEARYVRLLATKRALPRWGYSLYEIEIYNP